MPEESRLDRLSRRAEALESELAPLRQELEDLLRRQALAETELGDVEGDQTPDRQGAIEAFRASREDLGRERSREIARRAGRASILAGIVEESGRRIEEVRARIADSNARLDRVIGEMVREELSPSPAALCSPEQLSSAGEAGAGTQPERTELGLRIEAARATQESLSEALGKVEELRNKLQHGLDDLQLQADEDAKGRGELDRARASLDEKTAVKERRLAKAVNICKAAGKALGKVRELRKELDDPHHLISHLRRIAGELPDGERLLDEIAAHESTIAEAEKQTAPLVKRIEESREKAKEALQTRQDLQGDVEEAERAAEAAGRDVEEMSRKLADARAGRARIESEVAQHREEIAREEGEAAKLESEKTRLEKERELALNRRARLQAEVEKLRNVTEDKEAVKLAEKLLARFAGNAG